MGTSDLVEVGKKPWISLFFLKLLFLQALETLLISAAQYSCCSERIQLRCLSTVHENSAILGNRICFYSEGSSSVSEAAATASKVCVHLHM